MIRIILAPEFNRVAKQLKKRYPNLMRDLNPILIQLETGDRPGDRIQNLPQKVYKVRVRNRDAQRGKRGGYRVIYYLETEEQIVLLTIYSKSDQRDIPTHLIRRIIEEYEAGGL